MGPLGATVEDVAAGYVKIAGPDESDEWTKQQPEIHLQGFYEARLEGIRLGWFPEWSHHSKPEGVQCYLSIGSHPEELLEFSKVRQ